MSMTRRTRSLVASVAVGAALALAACGDDDDGAGDEAASGSATVAVATVGDAGEVLVDSSGAALYTADQEADGEIRCTASCAKTWLPLTVTDGAEPTGTDVPGTLATVARPDGSSQVTYDGAPLYTFADDGPGQVTGDGLSDNFGGETFSWTVASVSDDSAEEEESSAPSVGGY
jgi:predicted lipoprotein with Yx(FWY)xxD motif